MSERRYLVCDSCGKQLKLPASQEAAKNWQRHSINRNGKLIIRHTCGECNPTTVIQRLKRG